MAQGDTCAPAPWQMDWAACSHVQLTVAAPDVAVLGGAVAALDAIELDLLACAIGVHLAEAILSRWRRKTCSELAAVSCSHRAPANAL